MPTTGAKIANRVICETLPTRIMSSEVTLSKIDAFGPFVCIPTQQDVRDAYTH